MRNASEVECRMPKVLQSRSMFLSQSTETSKQVTGTVSKAFVEVSPTRGVLFWSLGNSRSPTAKLLRVEQDLETTAWQACLRGLYRTLGATKAVTASGLKAFGINRI